MTEYDNSKIYIQYCEDIISKRIVSCEAIYLACVRFKKWFSRDDIYFDYDDVDRRIRFVAKMKHSIGVHSGKPFILLPWQQFLFAGIYGWKYVDTNYRVTRNVLAFMARKSGKTATASAISLIQTTIDKENGAEIDFVANSAQQARIAFEMSHNFSASLDPNRLIFKRYRDSIKVPVTQSKVQVLCSDSMSLDGYNSSTFIQDEMHAQRNWDLYNVMISSQGMRTQPLAIVISTAGFLLDGYPLYDMRQTCFDILREIKSDDSMFCLMYELDANDDWMNDETCWVKANPSLGQTVSYEYLRNQIQSVRNNPSLETGVKTKNFNVFCMAQDKWLERGDISNCMENVELSDYKGEYCYIGLDLAAVSDLTALTVFIPKAEKPIFKSYAFIPYETYIKSPNNNLYERWKKEGTLIITEGNVTDYDYVIDKIQGINNICPVQDIFYDPYNATQMIIDLTNLGFTCTPFSQALGNFNKCTKQLERLIRTKSTVIDKSTCTLWCFENTTLKYDHNDNCKPVKGGSKNGKIDIVIAMCTSLGGYLASDMYTNNEIWIV